MKNSNRRTGPTAEELERARSERRPLGQRHQPRLTDEEAAAQRASIPREIRARNSASASDDMDVAERMEQAAARIERSVTAMVAMLDRIMASAFPPASATPTMPAPIDVEKKAEKTDKKG
jgi:hypothetical protein